VSARRVDAIVFDLDGVLVDSEPLWHVAELEVFRALGVPLTTEGCLETTGLRVDAVVRHWHARHPWSAPDLAEVEARVVERVAALIAERAQPMAHARAAVEDARVRGLRLGLASSSPVRVIEAALERLGLRAALACVRSAEQLARGKPDPAVYLLACADLAVEPARAVAVEDSQSGILAARAAGMRVVAVPDPRARPPAALSLADEVLPDLGGLSGALDRLGAPRE
jgi:sugar-phosphatase